MQRLTGLVVCAFCLSLGCSKPKEQQVSNRIEISHDLKGLGSRVHYENTPINLKGHNKTINPFQLSLIAQVDPPIVNGKQTVASHVSFNNNRAYVTYHTFGEAYGGAIEIFDVSNPSNPILSTSLIITDTDFHNLDIDGTNLYAAGARNVSSSGHTQFGTKGAIAQRYELSNDLIVNSPEVEVALSSYATTSISRSSTGVIASTGDQGGHALLLSPNTLDIIELDNAGDVKYFGQGPLYYAAVVGTVNNAQLLFYYSSVLSVAPSLSVPLPGNVISAGKNALKCYPGYVIVALGEEGIFKIDANNGDILNSFKNGNSTKAIAAEEIGSHIFVAHGSEGVIILDNNYQKLATYELGSGAHVNYLASDGNVIFLATGDKGLQILAQTPSTP